MHDRPVLRLLRDEGESIRGIAREQKASRNAVRRALVPGSRDRYYRSSASEDAEPAVRDVLADYPQMVVADIAVLIDWRHSRRTLSDLVARLRPESVASWSAVETKPISAIRAGLLSTSKIRCGTMTLGELKL
jgi:transposase